jgi:hypothetical protein
MRLKHSADRQKEYDMMVVIVDALFISLFQPMLATPQSDSNKVYPKLKKGS